MRSGGSVPSRATPVEHSPPSSGTSTLKPTVEHYLRELQQCAATALGLPEHGLDASPDVTGGAATCLLGTSAADLSPEDYRWHAANLTLCQEEPET